MVSKMVIGIQYAHMWWLGLFGMQPVKGGMRGIAVSAAISEAMDEQRKESERFIRMSIGPSTTVSEMSCPTNRTERTTRRALLRLNIAYSRMMRMTRENVSKMHGVSRAFGRTTNEDVQRYATVPNPIEDDDTACKFVSCHRTD